MKFSKTITVEIEAEPTSEDWFIECSNDNTSFNTLYYPTFEEAFNALPEEFKDLARRAFAQPLSKKEKKATNQYWVLYDHAAENRPQVCICHHYHFDFDFTTHVEF